MSHWFVCRQSPVNEQRLLAMTQAASFIRTLSCITTATSRGLDAQVVVTRVVSSHHKHFMMIEYNFMRCAKTTREKHMYVCMYVCLYVIYAHTKHKYIHKLSNY